jgi:uncharacterized protein (DUF58 family)
MTTIDYSDIFYNIEKFKLYTKNIVHGYITGIHKSPFHGFSVEFSDHRPYNSGDSIDHIDWKIFAKTNKYFIKRFEDETNVPVYIVLDHSNSMKFQSDHKKLDKLSYSKIIATTLAYLSLSQRDAIGLFTVNDQITSYLPAKSKQNWLDQFIQNINVTTHGGETSLSDCLHKISEKIKKRNCVILISDFLEDMNYITSALNHLKHNMNDVILVNVNDLQELNFKYNSALELYDLETDEMIKVNTFDIKKEYLEKVAEHYKQLKNEALKLNYDYVDFVTDNDYSKVLTAFLNKRRNI